MDDPVEFFRERYEVRRRSEDVAAHQLALHRESEPLGRQVLRSMTNARDADAALLEALLDLVEAEAKEVAVAQQWFAAAVDAREATEKLLREFEERRDAGAGE